MNFKKGDKVERLIKMRSFTIDGATEAWLPCTVVEVVPAGQKPAGQYPWVWDAKMHDWCIVQGDDDLKYYSPRLDRLRFRELSQ